MINVKEIVNEVVAEKEETVGIANQLVEAFSIQSDEDGYFDYRGCITTLINKGIEGKTAVKLTEEARLQYYKLMNEE